MIKRFSYFISLLIALMLNCVSTTRGNNIQKIRVYFFVSTTCPISQQYTKEINRLQDVYGKQGVEMILVFPNDGKKNIIKEIESFIKTYELSLGFINDKRFKLTKKFDATVTPEAFLISESNSVLYHGAIDNWYYQLGKNRINITEHYLEDAILDALNNKQIARTYVAPTGCFIEFRNK